MKHSSSLSAPLSQKLVGNIRQHSTQNFIAAPSLKAPMHRFVIRIALRQHVPLRTGVENPQYCLKHAPRRHWFASGTLLENVSGGVPIARC
jgi:hypothetical protein